MTVLKHLYIKINQTLVDHTIQVVELIEQWQAQAPYYREVTGDSNFWEKLKLAGILHNLGKVAIDYQQALNLSDNNHNQQPENHDYEVLSLVWTARILSRLPDALSLVGFLMTSYHHPLENILQRYGGQNPDQQQRQARQSLLEQLHKVDDDALQAWLPVIVNRYVNNLQFIWQKIPAHTALDTGLQVIEENLPSLMSKSNLNKLQWMRGILMHCNLNASRQITELPALKFDIPAITDGLHLYSHQQEIQKYPDATLIAPSAYGKTRSALLWAASQHQQEPFARLFYVVPYQASLYAIANCLSQIIEGQPFDPHTNQQISLLHSHISQSHYQTADNDTSPLYTAPIMICTPYELIQAIATSNDNPIVLAMFVRARIIIDGLNYHATRPFGTLLATLTYLHQNYQTHHLLMTTAIPSRIHRLISTRLPTTPIVKPNDDEYQQIQRHRIHLVDSDLSAIIPDAIEYARNGERVLIVTNRTVKAQAIYRQLLGQSVPVHLLHGRFNEFDRQHIESELLQKIEFGKSHAEGFMLITTQAIEVCLEVDFDRLYSEPAPLEALLQRFGRINRYRPDDTICPVFVCKKPDDNFQLIPLDAKSVRRTIQLLEQHDGEIIDESHINQWLDTIYNEENTRSWYKPFRRAFHIISEELEQVARLDAQSNLVFHKFLDAYRILPASQREAYEQKLKSSDYLGAYQYTVPIGWLQFRPLTKRGLITSGEDNIAPPQLDMDISYSPDEGLQIDWEGFD